MWTTLVKPTSVGQAVLAWRCICMLICAMYTCSPDLAAFDCASSTLHPHAGQQPCKFRLLQGEKPPHVRQSMTCRQANKNAGSSFPALPGGNLLQLASCMQAQAKPLLGTQLCPLPAAGLTCYVEPAVVPLYHCVDTQSAMQEMFFYLCISCT